MQINITVFGKEAGLQGVFIRAGACIRIIRILKQLPGNVAFTKYIFLLN